MLFFILNMYCSSDTLIQPHVLWFPRTPRHVGSTQTLLCLQTPFILEQMTILNTRRRQPCFGTDSVIKATFECIGARKPKWAYYWSRIKTFPSSYLDEVQGSWRRLLPTNQCNNKRLRRPFQLCLHKTNAGQGRRAKKNPRTSEVRRWPRSRRECNLQTLTFMKRKETPMRRDWCGSIGVWVASDCQMARSLTALSPW